MTDVTLGPPRRAHRLERGGLPGRSMLGVGAEDLEHDIEVANRPEAGTDEPKVAAIGASSPDLEPVPEHSPCRSDAATRDAHRVDLFGILAADHPGDVGEHPRQVEADHLAPGLGPAILDKQVGGPSDGQAFERRSPPTVREASMRGPTPRRAARRVRPGARSSSSW